MNCPYCKADVYVSSEKCPLCQSKLMGSDARSIFPKQELLKKRSFLYKIQLFVAVVAIIAAVALDFLFGVRIGSFTELHFSLLLLMWIAVTEFEVTRQLSSGTGSSRKITAFVLAASIMLMITAYYFDILWLVFDWIVPLALAAAMAANFVLAFLDKQGNSMAYLLTILFVGMLPFAVLCFRHKEAPLCWMICTIAGAVLFAGLFIFKGREAMREIRRRLSL